MFKFTLLLTLLLGIAQSSWAKENPKPSAQKVAQWLEEADTYRLQNKKAKIVSKVELFHEQELSKTNIYHVYTRPQRQSLVVFKTAGEQGQKMLMLGDNYWLLMPKSRRPIRITPMQKLLGEASVGDVATLTWSQDYQGHFIETQMLQGQACIKLELTSINPSSSYAKINLWLTEQERFPIQAELYLKSGKLAKTAQFDRGLMNGKAAVTAMQLVDQIQNNKLTTITYISIEAWQLADKYYNPAYLSRQKVSHL